jgi:hypothetical protein
MAVDIRSPKLQQIIHKGSNRVHIDDTEAHTDNVRVSSVEKRRSN